MNRMIRNILCMIMAGMILFSGAEAAWITHATSSLEVAKEFTNPIYFTDLVSGNRTMLMSGYHPLLGQSFNFDPLILGQQSSLTPSGVQPYRIGSFSSPSTPVYSTDFNQGWEKNLKYAQTRSSMMVTSGGNWSNLGTPWLIFDNQWR